MKKWGLGCLGVLVVCLILWGVDVTLMRMPNPRVARVNLHDLLVDISAFPQGWSMGYEEPIPGRENQKGAEETRTRRLRPKGFDPTGWDIWSAGHDIYRYRNPYQAINAYFLEHRLFSQGRGISPWTVPVGWSYRSPVADQFQFACAQFSDIVGSGTTCLAKAQYDEFTSIFSTRIDPTHMTYADLERVLRAIDERMARTLGKHTPPLTTPP